MPTPGAILNLDPESLTGFITRAKFWRHLGMSCGSGHWQSSICIFRMRNLTVLVRQSHFFANNFLSNFEPAPYDLLEPWILMERVSEIRWGAFAPIILFRIL